MVGTSSDQMCTPTSPLGYDDPEQAAITRGVQSVMGVRLCSERVGYNTGCILKSRPNLLAMSDDECSEMRRTLFLHGMALFDEFC